MKKIFKFSVLGIITLLFLSVNVTLSSCKKETVITVRDTITVNHTDTLIQIDTITHTDTVCCDTSILDLFTGKQWIYDEYYLSATDSTNGVLKYKRGASNNAIDLTDYRAIYWKDGTADEFRNDNAYNLDTWYFANTDSTVYITKTYDGTNPATILLLDSTHLNWIDTLHHARAKMFVK